MFWIIWDILNSLKWWIYDSHGVQSPERHYNLQLRCHNCLKAPWHTLCRSECVVWGHYIAVVINEWFKSSSVSVHLLIYNKHNPHEEQNELTNWAREPWAFHLNSFQSIFRPFCGKDNMKQCLTSHFQAVVHFWVKQDI